MKTFEKLLVAYDKIFMNFVESFANYLQWINKICYPNSKFTQLLVNICINIIPFISILVVGLPIFVIMVIIGAIGEGIYSLIKRVKYAP